MVREQRPKAVIVMNGIFFGFTVLCLVPLGMMAYGMILDNATSLLFFPVVLFVIHFTLLVFITIELFTGKAVETTKKVFNRI